MVLPAVIEQSVWIGTLISGSSSIEEEKEEDDKNSQIQMVLTVSLQGIWIVLSVHW